VVVVMVIAAAARLRGGGREPQGRAGDEDEQVLHGSLQKIQQAVFVNG
jgi:hypothetical protein